ncbi:MAG: B12-binding domain-containing radical SAM protein, partial [Chloroflexota bacterium]
VRLYGVRNVKFADELFVLNPRHVHGICDGIIERGYDLNIWAYARVDSVKDDMIEKLRRAGVNWLAFGIEAGNDRVRDGVHKGVSQREVYRTVQAVRDTGIHVIGNYIFGLPDDDLASMQDTLNMAQKLNCEFANFYCAMAYPGSQLYQVALKEGWQLPESWSGYSQHSVDTLPLPTKHLTGGEVLRFRDQAFHTYFNAPRYLKMVEDKFGVDTVRHIQEMAGHRLVRRYGEAPVATQSVGDAPGQSAEAVRCREVTL